MTTRIAIVLALIICALLALDAAMGWGGGLFLARYIVALIPSLAFWR